MINDQILRLPQVISITGPCKPVQFSDCALQIIETWKLKKMGDERYGPCPNCGGENRFWIYCIPPDILAMTCRGCGGRGQKRHLYRLAR